MFVIMGHLSIYTISYLRPFVSISCGFFLFIPTSLTFRRDRKSSHTWDVTRARGSRDYCANIHRTGEENCDDQNDDRGIS